jgi:uncharacterized protein YndB with AHSA1/START domain
MKLNENGKALTEKKFFSRETGFSINIKADTSIIWALLTNAADYPRWNKTVTSIQGNIALGETIQLKSVLDAKRVFKLKVKELETGKKLVWGDAMGNRVYTLQKKSDNLVNFSMIEKIGGPLFPLFAGMIPAFDETFEQFATSLKNEAELINNTKN